MKCHRNSCDIYRSATLRGIFCLIYLVLLIFTPTGLAQEDGQTDGYHVLFVNERIELTPWCLAMFSECRAEFERVSGQPVSMMIESAAGDIFGAKADTDNRMHLKDNNFIVYRNPHSKPPLHRAMEIDVPLVVPTCDEAWIPNTNEIPQNVYIRTVTLSPARSARLVTQLCPWTRTLVVISGDHETDHFLMQRARTQMGAHFGGLAVEYWEGIAPVELKKRAAALPRDHAILFLKLTHDPSGAMHISRDVVRDLVEYSPVPIFGIADTFVEEGILGGYVVSSLIEGQRTGQMLAKLANGAPLRAIEHVEDYGEYQFNWEQMKRWGIRENRLPSGAKILHRPNRLCERHPWLPQTVWSAVIALALILCTGLRFLYIRRKELITLKKNAAWLRLSTETSGVAVWEYDLVKKQMARSQNHESLYGLEPHDIWTKDNFMNAIHPEDRELTAEIIDRSIVAGGPERYRLDYRTLWPDNSVHWLLLIGEISERNAEGTATQMRGCLMDITERKLAEKAISSERDRAQQYLDIAGVMLLALDKNQTITMVNTKGCELLGAPQKEIVGKNWIETFLPNEDFESVNAIYKQIMSGNIEQFEHYENPILRLDGQQRTIAWINSLLSDSKGNIIGLLCSGEDITERKLAEEALQKSEEKARLMAKLVMRSDQPVAVGFADGRLGRINPAFCRLTGYTENELLAIDWATKLTPPEWLPTEREALTKLERTGEPVRYEKEYIHKDGRRIPIELFVNLACDSDGAPDYYYAFITDITVRKQEQESIRLKQYYLECAQALGKIGSWNLDAQKNELNWTNENYRIFGVPLGSPISYEWFLTRIHPEDRDYVDQKWNAAIQGEEPYDITHRIKMDDGKVKWVREKANLIFDDSGNLLKGTGFTQDITEFKGNQAKLQLISDSLENSLNAFDIIDAQGLFSYANQSYVDMWGYDSVEEIIGTSPAKHCLDPEQPEKIISSIQTTGKFEGEFIAKRKNGSTFKVQMYARMAYDNDGNVIFPTTSIDVSERARAEAELLRTRNTLLEAQKIAHLGSFEYIAATQDTLWSEEEYRIYGRDPKTPAPSYYIMLTECIYHEDADLLNDTFMKAVKTLGIYELEHRIVRPDGTVRWIHERAVPNFDEQGNLVRYIGVTHDINELKRTQEELQKEKNSLQFALEVSRMGAWNLNLHDRSFHRTPRHDQIFGYDPPLDGWTYKMFLEHVVLEDRDEVDRKFQNAVAHGLDWNVECRINRADSQQRWIAAIGRPGDPADGEKQLMGGVVQDITEQKQAEKKLKESEESLRLMFEQSPLPICMNDFEGKFILANPSYQQLTGYTQEELQQKTFYDVTHPDDRPENMNYTTDLSQRKADTFRMEKRYLRKDGSEVSVIIHGSSVCDSKGRPLFGLAFVEDVTELNRVQKDLQKAHDLLEHRVKERTAELKIRKDEAEMLNRGMINVLEDLKETNLGLETAERSLRMTNKELETFSYSVSHDLRAPLRHIDGFVRLLLKRENDLDTTSAHYLNTIAHASDRMGQLIDDLLAFSRTNRTKIHTASIDMNSVVKQTINELSAETHGHQITWEISDLPLAQADGSLIRQVWENLIGNAIKYTGNRDQARIEIGTTREGSNDAEEVVFFIRDNGAGFDPLYTDKLFGVFQRLHREDEFEGTGIGLATVRRIVHRHRGRVWAKGAVDQGATFYFTLKKAKGTE